MTERFQPHNHESVDRQVLNTTELEIGYDKLGTVDDTNNRFNIDSSTLAESYITSEEELIGFGKGGSESLVLFINSQKSGETIVRKIWSERLVSVKWDSDGLNVMTPPLEKAKLQVDYLRNLPDEVKQYFPIIYDFREVKTPDTNEKGEIQGEKRALICDQSYIPGIEVSSFIEHHQPSSLVVAHTYREIFRCLREEIHLHRKTESDNQTIEASYLEKITGRLKIAQETAPETFNSLVASDYVWINGIRYRNMPQLLNTFRNPEFLEILEPKYHSLVMGDTNTENVKITNINPILDAMKNGNLDFTYKDIGIKFLDPRAIGFQSGGKDVVDDYMYDNKPLHNSLGNYDIIHAEHFRIHSTTENREPHIKLEALEDHPFKEPYRDIEKYFPYIMEGFGINNPEFLSEDPNWIIRFAFIMGTHFAAMPPFHFKKELDGQVNDNCQPQKRAIAVYCEGVKWLNTAHDMLTGDLKELYGIPVPPITKKYEIFDASNL